MPDRLAWQISDLSEKEYSGLQTDSWIPLDTESFATLRELGARIEIPNTFYDPSSYDDISIKIYNYLLEAVKECDLVLKGDGESPFLNLSAIFFHEALRISCAYLYKRSEIAALDDFELVSPDETRQSKFFTLPYVDYDFVLHPERSWHLKLPGHVLATSKARRAGQNIRDGLQRAGNLINGSNLSVLSYAPNAGSEASLAVSVLNEINGGKWRSQPYRLKDSSIFIPRVELQYDILGKHIKAAFESVGYALPDSLAVLTRSWIFSFISRTKRSLPNASIYLSGSLTRPVSRVGAASYRSVGVPVVSIFHGETCGTMDEPMFGYGENAFADAVIGYGEDGCRIATSSKFSYSLFEDPVKYVPSTSEQISSTYQGQEPTAFDPNKRMTWMYVPTSFSGSARYGPFRDIHDVAYLQWQIDLLSTLREAVSGRVIWKPHRKGKSATLPGYLDSVDVVNDHTFEDILDMADVFVFDYISSAFSIAAATNKPIVYLDIGLRNLCSLAQEDVEKRCVYVRANPQEAKKAIEAALQQTKLLCNHYSKHFSLSMDDRPRHEVIADTISNIVGG